MLGRAERRVCAVMETTMTNGVDLGNKATIGGGVEDVYGEDFATEDQLITPWTVSVAR